MPGPDLLAAVERYLDRRRLITTDVHVVAPRYVEVSVNATLHLDAGADPDEATRAARKAIDRFFDPLAGGPEGEGWPAGRGVYRTEIMALLTEVPGVLRVTDMTLALAGDCSPRCANVESCPTDLVAPGPHRLLVRAQAATRVVPRSVEHECP
jgi:phage-related baseplate assembly protein